MTGGDLAPRQQAYRYGPHPPPPDFSRQMHPQQMHYQPTYPPYGYYGQPPPPSDLCYPYYPPKYYPNSPYARRPYVGPPGYYQPAPLDYRPPPQPVPQNNPQQIVSAAPTPQHHIDPHYSNSPYYPSYNTGGQCYSQTPPRNLQPPAYLGEEMYDIVC